MNIQDIATLTLIASALASPLIIIIRLGRIEAAIREQKHTTCAPRSPATAKTPARFGECG